MHFIYLIVEVSQGCFYLSQFCGMIDKTCLS